MLAGAQSYLEDRFCKKVSRSSACSSSTAKMSSSMRRVVVSWLPSQSIISLYEAMATRSATRSSLTMSSRSVPGAYSAWLRAVEGVGVEVGLALELHDARRDEVGVSLLLGGVLEELGRHRARVDALGHVVVPLVAQHADQLGGQRLVEDGDDPGHIGPVGVGDRALLDVGAGILAQRFYVRQEFSHGRKLPALPGDQTPIERLFGGTTGIRPPPGRAGGPGAIPRRARAGRPHRPRRSGCPAGVDARAPRRPPA